MTREEAIEMLNNLRECTADEAIDMAIEALTHEIRTETHGVRSNLISRQDAIDALAGEWYNCAADYRTAVSAIGGLPSADTDISYYCDRLWKIAYERGKADRPTGTWIDIEDWDGDIHYQCDQCKEEFIMLDGTPKDNDYNFCPSCGAKMKGNKNV